MKRNIFLFLAGVIGVISSCSDISDTQKEFLDEGETNYVGKLDSIVVYGGNNRVDIVGKKTYMHNVAKFVVEWVDMEGERFNKEFPFEETLDGDSIRMTISPLDEGDYTFYVSSVDEFDNRSLAVEAIGSSYGEKYKASQSPLSIIGFSLGDKNGDFNLELSTSKDAVRCKVDYKDADGNDKSIVSKDFSEKIVLKNWENSDESKIYITTYVAPSDKKGMDTLALEPVEQTIIKKVSKYDIDRTKCKWMQLTAYGEDGNGFGAQGKDALFDGRAEGIPTEFWSDGSKLPGHFCFDMGVRKSVNKVSIIGRYNSNEWDVVKFELWGRETIDDGPGGDTGYEIQSKDSDEEAFIAEAIQRGWKKIGNGWFTYPQPKSNPSRAECLLTDITDPNFTPRYILFRVKTALTTGGNPNSELTGEDGGHIGGFACFDIGELSLSGEGVEYVIE